MIKSCDAIDDLVTDQVSANSSDDDVEEEANPHGKTAF